MCKLKVGSIVLGNKYTNKIQLKRKPSKAKNQKPI